MIKKVKMLSTVNVVCEWSLTQALIQIYFSTVIFFFLIIVLEEDIEWCHHFSATTELEKRRLYSTAFFSPLGLMRTSHSKAKSSQATL